MKGLFVWLGAMMMAAGLCGSAHAALTAEECRLCHDANGFIPEQHHALLGTTITAGTDSPYDPPGGSYRCDSCHVRFYDNELSVYVIETVRDCLQCHKPSSGQIRKTTVARGTITLSGSGFGARPSSVHIGSYDAATGVMKYSPAQVVHWSDTQITARDTNNAAPTGASIVLPCENLSKALTSPKRVK